MGVVWAAKDEPSGEGVALKLLKNGVTVSAEARRRFFREARAASAANHPNIVKVREVVADADGSPVIVMEHLDGETLGARLARGALSLKEFARIMVPTVSALGTAHALGIVHRDLKPDNLFLVKSTSEPDVRVLDFGIAKLTATEGAAAQTESLTGTGVIVGTPKYMSPEQIYSEADIDHRTDIWSLGVIFYECLTGRHAIPGDNLGQCIKAITAGAIVPIGQVSPMLPARLVDLCGRMLSVDRNARPKDLREVLEVVQGFTDIEAPSFDAPTLEVQAASPHAVIVDGPASKRAGRRWLRVGLSSGAILALAAAGFAVVSRTSERTAALAASEGTGRATATAIPTSSATATATATSTSSSTSSSTSTSPPGSAVLPPAKPNPASGVARKVQARATPSVSPQSGAEPIVTAPRDPGSYQ